MSLLLATTLSFSPSLITLESHRDTTTTHRRSNSVDKTIQVGSFGVCINAIINMAACMLCYWFLVCMYV